MSELATQNNGLAKTENKSVAKPDESKEFYSKLFAFNKKYLNASPDPKWIKTNQGVKYLPIRIVENLLASIFGIWQAEMIGRPQILGNSVEVSVHLKVYHPVLREWITYPGTGAVPIQLRATKKDKQGNVIGEKGAEHPLDFEKIISTALHKNVPSALSFAINNAAKKIGKVFGSDLNSDEITETYKVYGSI